MVNFNSEVFFPRQISDFLSGRSPLTINLGIGAHVMYVQLQLSAQNVAELQQQHWDLRAEGSSSSSSSERQTGLPTTVRTSHPDSAWTNSTGSTTSPASQTSTPTPDSSDSASSTQFSAQSPRTSSNSTAPMPHSSTTATAVNCHHHSSPHQPCPPNSTHTSSSSISTPHFSSGCPHPSCPLQAATPVCSSSPTGSIPGPQSPAPASTFQEVSLTYSTVCLCIISIYKCTCMYKIHKMEIIFLPSSFLFYRVVFMLHPLQSCASSQEQS